MKIEYKKKQNTFESSLSPFDGFGIGVLDVAVSFCEDNGFFFVLPK